MLLQMRIALIGILLPVVFASPRTLSADDSGVSPLDTLHNDSASWQEKYEALRTLHADAVKDPSVCLHVAKSLATMDPRFVHHAIGGFFGGEDDPCSSQNLALFKTLRSQGLEDPAYYALLGEDEMLTDPDFIRFLIRTEANLMGVADLALRLKWYKLDHYAADLARRVSVSSWSCDLKLVLPDAHGGEPLQEFWGVVIAEALLVNRNPVNQRHVDPALRYISKCAGSLQRSERGSPQVELYQAIRERIESTVTVSELP